MKDDYCKYWLFRGCEFYILCGVCGCIWLDWYVFVIYVEVFGLKFFVGIEIVVVLVCIGYLGICECVVLWILGIGRIWVWLMELYYYDYVFMVGDFEWKDWVLMVCIRVENVNIVVCYSKFIFMYLKVLKWSFEM